MIIYCEIMKNITSHPYYPKFHDNIPVLLSVGSKKKYTQ